jgi:hypothetical protein
LIDLNRILVKKIVCGQNHSLLLSTNGDLYESETYDKKKISKTFVKRDVGIKFDDIWSLFLSNISVDKSIGGYYDVWKQVMQYNKEILYEKPMQTIYQSIHDLIATYSTIKITYKPILNCDIFYEISSPENDSVIHQTNNENEKQEKNRFKRLKTEITINNICAINSMAIENDLQSLKTQCKQFAKNNSHLIRKRIFLMKDLLE